MTYPNVLFSVLSFFGFVICCVPFAAQLKARNIATCLYMIWTGLACLNQFTNSVIWNNNMSNHAPVWCDISARIIVGSAVAIPACSLCINRRLYHILSSREPLITPKRLSAMVDLGIGVGLPAIAIILQYVSQGRRYDIYQDIGCYPVTQKNPIGIVLVWTPSIVISCLSSIYTILNLHRFLVIRPWHQFIHVGQGSPTLWIRLLFITGMHGFCIVPLAALSLYFNHAFSDAAPCGDWEMSHSAIMYIDRQHWRNVPDLEATLEFSRWLVVAFAFTFFILFGVGEEVLEGYRSCFSFVLRRILDPLVSYVRRPERPTHDPTLTLPV